MSTRNNEGRRRRRRRRTSGSSGRNDNSSPHPERHLREYQDEFFELHLSNYPREKVNGKYQFLKMKDSRPVFEHVESKVVFGWWSRFESWTICKDEKSFESPLSHPPYGLVRENVYNPIKLTKRWHILEGDDYATYKWVRLNESLTITTATRIEARGKSLNKYKPGRYELKGHLPVYESYGSLDHTQMLERHCLIDITAIHANVEDDSSDLIYGQCEHGFVPLGEYHGKTFVKRVSEVPENTEEEQSR